MFDFDIIKEAACDAGFAIAKENSRSVAVELAKGYVLVFDNGDEEDGILYFCDGGSWHSHGDLFAIQYKTDVELAPAFMLRDLKKGILLISKHMFQNGQIEISLVFGAQIGDVNYYLDGGEEILFKKLA